MTTTKHSERPTLTLADLRDGTRATVTVPEASAVLGLSPWVGYQAAQRGEIPTLRIGRRLVVPVPALLRMLDGEPVDEPTALARPKR
ncbi:hypothetical protein AB0P19_13650 [Microbacterium oleivorans]|uniref:hypothetical protein n=1 Tax=Microbacterium oleivorans TaxID=273677 RepID=UPI0033E40BE5